MRLPAGPQSNGIPTDAIYIEKDRRKAVFLFRAGHFANVRSWHMTAFVAPQNLGRYRTNNGQRAALGLDLSAAIDPSATVVVHCGNGFDAGFSPYQSGSLSR